MDRDLNKLNKGELGESLDAMSSSGPGQEPGDDGQDDSSESEDISSSSAADLLSFRQQWESELMAKKSQESGNEEEDIDQKARLLFLKGVSMERSNNLYEAVQFYRRALQLDPDIEHKVNELESKDQTETMARSVRSTPEEEDGSPLVDFEESSQPLGKIFMSYFEENGGLLLPKNKSDNRSHLSDLPVEVIAYILRWVISSDLDLRSLDVLSGVCKGFYCLCRDEQIWRLACERVWGSCNILDGFYPYISYRDMFLKRTRVRFDGCYISKVSYVRAGEHSFQDHSYRPWHLVEYFRYIRFYPDGSILFLTTSDPPGSTVSSLKLKDTHPRSSNILRGKYQIYGENKDMVDCMVRLNEKNKSKGKEAYFHLQFLIKEIKGKPNWILSWSHYAHYSKSTCNFGADQVTEFELNASKFPPLYFSRVLSYSKRAERILE